MDNTGQEENNNLTPLLAESETDRQSPINITEESITGQQTEKGKINNKNMTLIRNSSLLLASGIGLGTLMPKNQDLPTPSYRVISSIIGYTYFLCWSISFYPQVILNHQRKSTVGLSPDFTILNVVGFLCYTIYSSFLFWNKGVQGQYRTRFDENSTVQSNDVAFAFHAVLLSSITFFQVLHYRECKGNGTNEMNTLSLFSKWTKYFLVGAGCICIVYAIMVYYNLYDLLFLDFLYLLSSIKFVITVIKYIPQVILNYTRKSTSGWNVWNVLLDFSGGMLSLLQLIGDCKDMGDWSGITGNWVKFGLGLVSILFDAIFILQHYVLYPQKGQGSGSFEMLSSHDEEVVG